MNEDTKLTRFLNELRFGTTECYPERGAIKFLKTIYKNPCKSSGGDREFVLDECLKFVRKNVCDAEKYVWPEPTDFWESITWGQRLCLEMISTQGCVKDDYWQVKYDNH